MARFKIIFLFPLQTLQFNNIVKSLCNIEKTFREVFFYAESFSSSSRGFEASGLRVGWGKIALWNVHSSLEGTLG